jgi:iron complex outermembrane receptor protein
MTLHCSEKKFRIGPTAIPLYGSIILSAPGYKIADESTLTEELQIQGRTSDDRLVWQTGGYMELERPLGTAGMQSANYLSCTDIAASQCVDILGLATKRATGRIDTTLSRTKFNDFGLYAQATYSISNQFKLTGGFRYTWDWQESDVSRKTRFFYPTQHDACADSQGILPDCAYSVEANSSAPTWLLGIDYNPTRDMLLYAKYSRGYRAGGALPSAPRGNQTYAPEKLDTFEVGLKASFLGAVHGIFNAAAFYNDFTNQQLRATFRNTVTTAAVTGITNAGTSRIYGVELDTSISPFEGFMLDGSYTYLNTKITQIDPVVAVDPNFTVASAIPVGAPLFYAPEHKLSVTARYTLPLDKTLGAVALGATYTYTSSRLGTYAYDLRTANGVANRAALGGIDYGTLPSFGILNLNLNWDSVGGRPIDFSIFATNVTGEKYYTGVAGLGGIAGYESAAIGEPQMYGVRFKFRFGY